MPKLVKNKYYNKNGEAKVNGYFVGIKKDIVQKAGFTGDENVVIKASKDKIIIEKSN